MTDPFQPKRKKKLLESIGPFRLYRSRARWPGDRYYWTLVAPNGKVLATSEIYNSKAGAIKGIQSARTNVTTKHLVAIAVLRAALMNCQTDDGAWPMQEANPPQSSRFREINREALDALNEAHRLLSD